MRLFAPKSIAIVGASANWARAGARVLRFVADGGYKGRVFPVNPTREELHGLRCYPSLSALPEVPDLAILAVSAEQTAATVTELGALGGRAAVCMAAGFRESGAAGAELELELTEAALKGGVIILGPNSVGFRSTAQGIYAVFATDVALGPLPGSIAVVSQSGGLAGYFGAAVAKSAGIGYRWIIDTGNEIDVDVADCIAYLSEDPGVSVIGLITEGCRDGDRLRASLETAKAAGKPVIAFKIGTSAAGAQAAASHTGALAGSDAVYDAVFRQHGVHRAKDEHDFIQTLAMYDAGLVAPGPNVAVFSLSGGLATLLVDQCAEHGLNVPPIPLPTDPEVYAALPSARFDNPMDLSGQIGTVPHILQSVLEHVLSQPVIDSVILGFAYMLQAKHISDVFVPALVAARERYPKPMIVAGLANEEAERELRKHGILVRPMPIDAVVMIAATVRSGTSGAPPASTVNAAAIVATSAGVAGSTTLETGTAAAARLPGIRYVGSVPVATADEAVAAAHGLGWPVVLKVDNAPIAHKSELGLVAAGLTSEEQLRSAIAVMQPKLDAAGGGDLVVQPHLDGIETVLGLYDDPTFGPTIMVGLGGMFVEILDDVEFGLPPIDREQAHRMLERLRGYPLLTGARGRPPARIEDLVDALITLSDAALEHRGHLKEIDINPFIVSSREGKSMAVDAVAVWAGPPPATNDQ